MAAERGCCAAIRGASPRGAAYNPRRMPRARILAIALGLLVLSTWITPMGRDLFVGDETKYGQVVREMRSTGAFFLPTLNGAPFTHKPPVHFWLIDLLTIPLGTHSMWAFVIPSLAAFVFLLWLMRQMGGPLAAFLCGASLMVWASAQTARMDVLFTALIALGLWQLRRFLEDDHRPGLILCGVSLGLATLVKGPMALVIGLVVLLFQFVRRRRLPAGHYGRAAVVMIAIPLAWFIPAVLVGGQAYAREVVVKQTVGRAIASWVHNAPPWFYLAHMPAALFPWFFAAVVAVIALWKVRPFLIDWIAAVLLPYSIMSSKLDVYMMALIPPVALLIAETVAACEPEGPDASSVLSLPATHSRRLRIANALSIGMVALVGVAGLLASPRWIHGPERELLGRGSVKMFFAWTAASAIVLLIASLRTSLRASTLAAGAAPVLMMVWVAIFLMPTVSSLSSTRPLVDVLQKLDVAPSDIALYAAPYLWTRDLPPRLEKVVYADPETLRRTRPLVIVTARAHASEIAFALAGYRKSDEVRMIGKWFDVYRR